MHCSLPKRITTMVLACALTACAPATTTSMSQAGLKRVDALGSCQEGDGTVWSYISSGPVTSPQEAKAFVDTLNKERYLGSADWSLPTAADIDRLHDYREKKQTGDCEMPTRLFLFVENESRPVRYETGLVGCGIDYRKDVNQTGVGHVRGIRRPR